MTAVLEKLHSSFNSLSAVGLQTWFVTFCKIFTRGSFVCEVKTLAWRRIVQGEEDEALIIKRKKGIFWVKLFFNEVKETKTKKHLSE